MEFDGCCGMQRYRHDFNSKKQRQEISSFKAEVEGDRVQVGDKTIQRYSCCFYLEGPINEEKQPSSPTFFREILFRF
jgi:hypothetical protein